ncbi:MAG TPA: dehydrogenase [Pseudomonas sp.]|nr:dehydrogenase [Pseudomonas sp.]MBB50235.1 dehydrogenase [Pseudomonadales bacterium]MBO08019.1 dehydrogenase [Acidobacteriota bacterium]MEE3158195.1 YciI family protein [Pseudomonadota bacterium]MBB50517.1 dehydrogenase [Pseudomonadales bacterium]|tara:strand:- start:1234 stop:1602 length:369 start_codon:yes stop_codon:yes gene_type:complete
MKYLCLVYYDEKKMQQLSQDEWDALNRECIACVAGLQASGHFLEGAPLLSTDTATTVRVRDGGPMITDGPFAETKEQLAGFYMLEARDCNEAIRLAQKIPPARYGSVEIRPVRELVESGNDI